jgi:hypothetical protein
MSLDVGRDDLVAAAEGVAQRGCCHAGLARTKGGGVRQGIRYI